MWQQIRRNKAHGEDDADGVQQTVIMKYNYQISILNNGEDDADGVQQAAIRTCNYPN